MINITLKAKYHAFVIALMPNRGEVMKINYINQVAQAVGTTFNPDQNISVNVEGELVASMYEIIGSQQERLTSVDNEAIKQALIPQLMAHPETLAVIQGIAANNASQTELIRQSGIDIIMSINL